MPPDGFPITPDSELTVAADEVEGRLVLALGRPDEAPVVLADVADAPVAPILRVLQDGDWILHISAHDHGRTPYDVSVQVQVQHADEDPVLVTRFRLSNPGNAGGSADGKEVHFTVSES